MTRQAVPIWYWAVSAILLLWSLAGVASFGAQVSMSAAQLAQLPPEQRDAFTAMPDWVWLAYGIATVSGLAAAICLFLRRKWAQPLYAASLVAVLVQFGWSFAGYGILGRMPAGEALLFPAIIVLIGVLSILFANLAARRGWLS